MKNQMALAVSLKAVIVQLRTVVIEIQIKVSSRVFMSF